MTIALEPQLTTGGMKEFPNIWINEDIAGSPPLQLPSYLRDRIDGRKRKMWASKTDTLSVAEAKRKALIEGRVRKLSDQADKVKKTVKDTANYKQQLAEMAIKRINERLEKAETHRSTRLTNISDRCQKNVAAAKKKRLDNIKRQRAESTEKLVAIKLKLAAGNARRNSEIRNRQLRSLAACRWCAARRIQVWWHIMMLKKFIKKFLETCPKELLGNKVPDTYADLRRIMISRNNITATKNVLEALYKFQPSWARKAGPRILLTAFMIKYFPRSVLAYNGELETVLMAQGEELVKKYRTLISGHSLHYRMVYQNVTMFGVAWSNYVKALDEWKCVDIDRLIAELHMYWEQLQEVKEAMKVRARAAKAAAGTLVTDEVLQDETDDSKAVIEHVKNQEQMVIDRLTQIGGQIAVDELYEKYPIEEDDEEEEDELLAIEPSPESMPAAETSAAPTKEFYESMAKMEMAHEIAVNADYRIEREQTKGLEGEVEQTLKAAFWDVLRDQVLASPPNYEHCVTLLAEIKGQLLGVIERAPPTHPLRMLITETLDIELIQQEIAHDTFSLPNCVAAIIAILLKLCSPSLDDEIKDIEHLTDVVDIFKTLYAVIDKIKLELANYHLEQAKPTIREHSAEYERGKFKEFLVAHPSGLDKTKAWLASNVCDSPMATITNSYLQLLTITPPAPETVALDSHRFTAIGNNLRTVLVCASLNVKLGSYHANLAEIPFLKSVQDTVYILTPTDQSPEASKDLIITKTADLCIAKLGGGSQSNLEKMVAESINSSGTVYKLFEKRLMEFMAECSQNKRPPLPKGFDAQVDEVRKCVLSYTQLVNYNRRVYGPFYAEILRALSEQSES